MLEYIKVTQTKGLLLPFLVLDLRLLVHAATDIQNTHDVVRNALGSHGLMQFRIEKGTIVFWRDQRNSYELALIGGGYG